MNPLQRAAEWAADENGQRQAATPFRRVNANRLDIEEFIRQFDIKVRNRAPWNGGQKLVLEVCPLNSDHTGGSAVITLGSDGSFGFKCQHNSCAGIGWKELRARLDPQYRNSVFRSAGMDASRVEGDNQMPPGVQSATALVESNSSAGTVTAAAPNPTSVNRDRVWPDELKPEAYYGVAGDWVKLVAPHTEADPAALLIQFLVAFGSLIGRGAHFRAEADKHFSNLFCVIVGQTAKGRKGSSVGYVKLLFRQLDADWSQKRVKGGLSSGEGLIWAVRDSISKVVTNRDKGKIVSQELQVVDEGEPDKRILLIETEFAAVLQRADRDKNTLSHIIRQAWDGGTLDTLVKNSPACATDAHVSIIGHITADELRRTLNSTEAGNGFANRFLFVCSKRSKCLPDGGQLDEVDFSGIVFRLKAAVSFARATGRMARDENAGAIWHAVYPELSEGKPGLLGSVTTRAEAQVLRLSCIYALLDNSATIRGEHLQAALAIWQYCESSARFIFGDALGDAVADEILQTLRNQPQGMTRTQVSDHFTRNKSAAEIGRALSVLQEHGLARVERAEQEGSGRPPERFFSVAT